jgi:enamine deaminase RidA (YjgF/YER057c/UK114 family)
LSDNFCVAFIERTAEMRMRIVGFAVWSLFLGMSPSFAQSVKHIQPSTPGGIATAVWAGDVLYVSGQLPSAQTPADNAAGKPAVWGNTQSQAENAFGKIEAILKEQGLTMGDVVMMRVYMVADPATNKLDFAGMNAAYNKYFGTPTQANKPARTTVQVAALVNPGPLLEIEVQAARNK